jgi:site-specific recombinase XerD
MINHNFAHLLTQFFSSYLPGHRNVSKNTIYSYRDTFSKLLTFFRDVRRIPPEKLTFAHFNRTTVEDFLIWLENDCGNGISTRNHRLTALRSFFRYVQVECPEYLLLCKDILDNTKHKKCPKPVIQYLNKAQLTQLLSLPDTSDSEGRRDLAILSVLYDSAARVQELCDLTVGSIRTEPPVTLTFIGKGRKSRYLRLSEKSEAILLGYMIERDLCDPNRKYEPLFKNRQGYKLTRGGISYILKKYVNKANLEHAESIPMSLTPHCLRHSKAMHMLEAGINIVYIRDFLDHEDLVTTQVYAKANPEVKRAALESAYKDEHTPAVPSWNDDPSLIKYLKGLSK